MFHKIKKWCRKRWYLKQAKIYSTIYIENKILWIHLTGWNRGGSGMPGYIVYLENQNLEWRRIRKVSKRAHNLSRWFYRKYINEMGVD